MRFLSPKTTWHELFTHETKHRVLVKFLLVIALLLAYFCFVIVKFGATDGILVTALTWSFFVLCTPIADAGFLIDFPLRLITKIRMLFSELLVWTIAISLNIAVFVSNPEVYGHTTLLSFFHQILARPIPFWGIIVISALGTFVSIQFGDELVDTVKHHERLLYHKHKKKHHLIIMVFIFAISFVLYDLLLKQLGVDISTL